MTDDLTDDELEEALAVLGGRKEPGMTAAEARYDLDSAKAWGRAPDPRAVQARERVRVAQEAVKHVAPWRAAVRWELYDELLAAEENLAALMSTRRGVTLEAARTMTTQLLRDAWAKGGTTAVERYAAMANELAHYTEYLTEKASVLPADGAAGKPSAMAAEAVASLVAEGHSVPMLRAAAAQMKAGPGADKDLTDDELDEALAKLTGRTTVKGA